LTTSKKLQEHPITIIETVRKAKKKKKLLIFHDTQKRFKRVQKGIRGYKRIKEEIKIKNKKDLRKMDSLVLKLLIVKSLSGLEVSHLPRDMKIGCLYSTNGGEILKFKLVTILSPTFLDRSDVYPFLMAMKNRMSRMQVRAHLKKKLFCRWKLKRIALTVAAWAKLL
jgi:ribosomal protein L44E